STYLGGSQSDVGNALTVDSSGNAYITGSTASPNFPVTPGVVQGTTTGSGDAFVTKLNVNGNGLVYSTYLGCSGGDVGTAIALDSSGNVHITGSTNSPNFPTLDAFQASASTLLDAFVTKLNTNGSALLYSTYLGGDGSDTGNGLSIDTAGNAYVTGSTGSTNSSTTTGAFQTAPVGMGDAFITKISPTSSGSGGAGVGGAPGG